MPRTLTITMEVEIDHLPADEIDDLEYFAGDEDITLDEAAASVLAEAGANEVAECIQQACFDPELFAGSCLYLKVLEATAISAAWGPDTAPVTSQIDGVSRDEAQGLPVGPEGESRTPAPSLVSSQ